MKKIIIMSLTLLCLTTTVLAGELVMTTSEVKIVDSEDCRCSESGKLSCTIIETIAAGENVITDTDKVTYHCELPNPSRMERLLNATYGIINLRSVYYTNRDGKLMKGYTFSRL